MEKVLVEKAKTQLQRTNTNKDLKIFSKAEPRPAFVTDELLPYYEQTDLSLRYVYDCCLSLKPLKGIDVSDMQVEFWYREFLRMGWKKKDFDKQLEAVKRATLYGRIDLDNWVKSEITYNEMDFRTELNREIVNLIRKGEQLKAMLDRGLSLTDEEKKYVELSVAARITAEYQNRRYELMEEWNEKLRKEYISKLKGKKKTIAELGMEERIRITNLLFDNKKVSGDKKSFLFQVTLHNLEDFADLVEDNWLLN